MTTESFSLGAVLTVTTGKLLCPIDRPCPTAATIQCDFAVASGKTCDAWCCDTHARQVGPDLHHCPTHAGRQAGLFTGIIS